MKIYSVADSEFTSYGRVITGYDTNTIFETLKNKTPVPEGVEYVPMEEKIQNLPEARALGEALYGGMPVQFGWCNGHNTKLNCLEYHRDSEFNLGTKDFILLLGKQQDIVDSKLDTATVKAFLVPAGILVEVYATSLHYAPCHANAADGFQVLVALPSGTNTEKPQIANVGGDDTLLWARNKWLIAHPDSAEAKAGAVIGLTGENIDLAVITDSK